MEIRRSRPEDGPAVRTMLTRCSERTLHLRFLSPVPVPESPSERSARVLADLLVGERAEGDATYVALADGEVLGVAELRAGGDGTAEVAFLVEDAHQGRGIGTALVRHVVADARDTGLRLFTAYLSGENRRMLGAFRSAGMAPTRTTSAGVTTLTMDITTDAQPDR